MAREACWVAAAWACNVACWGWVPRWAWGDLDDWAEIWVGGCKFGLYKVMFISNT